MAWYDQEQHGALNQSETEPTIRSRYTIMLVEYDRRIPFRHTCLATFSQWLLLAGYLVVPGTFTSLQQSGTLDDAPSTIVQAIQNPPLLAIACVCLVAGASLMTWLAWRWRYNYIWLSRLFRPTALNALAGLVTTLINVYSARNGDWSVMALLTVIVTAIVMVTSLTLTIYFYCFRLADIKKEHEEDVRQARRARWRHRLAMHP